VNAIRLGLIHLDTYRELMLEGYALHPDAFTSTATERADLPLSWWQARLSDGPSAATEVFGVQRDTGLAGAVALSFESRPKTRHKATLVGLYVREAFRHHGAGSALVTAVLAAARARPGVLLVQLTVSNHNVAAKRLYARHGFVEFGVEPYAMAVGDGYVEKCHMWCDLGRLSALAPHIGAGVEQHHG
jgi:ribosomal protein S18 acetylase RimI-like enzyme